MMILHHGWRSSASRRVRLCLAEKGLVYEGHVVDMAAMEHHSPEYLRINPLGVIPTLIHDGRPLHEAARSASISTKRFQIGRCGLTHPTSAPRCATGSGTSTG